jgi:hypothetical protein
MELPEFNFDLNSALDKRTAGSSRWSVQGDISPYKDKYYVEFDFPGSSAILTFPNYFLGENLSIWIVDQHSNI